jgi:hypothetical protein
LKVVAAEFGEEQITRLACCGGEKRRKKIERATAGRELLLAVDWAQIEC